MYPTGKGKPTAKLTASPDGHVLIGDTVTLTCEIECHSDWTYKWYKDTNQTRLPCYEHTYTITGAAGSDKGQYWCQGERKHNPKTSNTRLETHKSTGSREVDCSDNREKSQCSNEVWINVTCLDNETLPLDDFRTLILVIKEMDLIHGRNICRSHYTDLVSLYDKTDEEQLLKLLQLAKKGHLGTLIGLTGSSNSYKWSNGDIVIYKKNDLNNHNNCVAMTANGGWDALNCTEKRPFICYSDAPSNSSRYTLIKEKKTWQKAQDYCRENYIDLVSIKDEQQNNAVFIEKKTNPNDSWIGLICDGWEWSDGGLSGYRNWSSAAFEPSKTAVRISHYEGWNPETNTAITPLICYKDHIHISDDSMTWEESLEYCRGFNGSFCILSEKEQLAAKRLMRRLNITKPVWVGLQQSSFLGFWVWTIGQTLAWNNWKGGQVPRLPLSHHCGALMSEKDDFKWADINCMTKQRALCFDWVVNRGAKILQISDVIDD
ncbi:macrophage mannose receptor 1-like isoform X2 [Alosa alosa]|uniref:macrophage mannose receptor 1-like isoform X2 n=1 Tax=Alosa alosa TaxID=278164 RepID=UPI002015094A|nr:macrophage mannose receptor 1-like isoform X2 [Alosa alosa]